MSEWREEKFESPLSGAALFKLMRDNKVKLSDVSISSQNVQYFENWEEDHIIIRWKSVSTHNPEKEE